MLWFRGVLATLVAVAGVCVGFGADPVSAVLGPEEATYILRFEEGADVAAAVETMEAAGIEVVHTYEHVFEGAAVRAPADGPVVLPDTVPVVAAEREQELTLQVEPPSDTTVPDTTVPDTVPDTTVPDTTVPDMTVPDTTVPDTTVPDTTVPDTTVPDTTVPDTTVPDTTVPTTTVPEEPPVPWGLDRSDQRELPLSGTYTAPSTGAGVRVYVVDSGIRSDHEEFGDRVSPGLDLIHDGGGTEDCHGHGTHVAGSIGGASVGMATEVELVPIRIADCGGSLPDGAVIRALDWIVEQHEPGRPAVVNLSLGGPARAALDDAVQAVIDAGVVVVTAAGNESVDACLLSPARVPAAITVGATDAQDRRASFSNHGPCVDVFAPGVDIQSADSLVPSGRRSDLGTSMSSPHVAGAVAVLLAQRPSMTPAQVADLLIGDATPDVVVDPGPGSPNRLLYSSPDALPPAPPEPPAPPAPEARPAVTVPSAPAADAGPQVAGIQQNELAMTGPETNFGFMAVLLFLAGVIAMSGAWSAPEPELRGGFTLRTTDRFGHTKALRVVTRPAAARGADPAGRSRRARGGPASGRR